MKAAPEPGTEKSCRSRPQSEDSSVYSRFLQELAAGTIKPGDRLGEPTLAARWNVSRPPVRDALNRLACEGIVERHPRSGTYVREFDRDEIKELYTLRGLIEVFVIAQVVEVVTDSQLDELEQLANEADACDRQIMSAEEIIGRETRFHLRLCEVANLRHTMRLLNIQHLLLRTLQISTQQRPAYPIRAHRDVVDALRTRDVAQCEAVVREIAEWSLDDVLAPPPAE
jgi:DNA-binding GntR family transcriptional regulator